MSNHLSIFKFPVLVRPSSRTGTYQFVPEPTIRWRTRTLKVRTPLSRPCPTGQAGNDFSKIRTESRQLTESRRTKTGQTDTGQKIRTQSGQDFSDNPETNETSTGHGQCCPPTSGTDWLKSMNPHLQIVSNKKPTDSIF